MSRYIDAEWLKQNFNTVFWSQVAKTIDSAPSIDICFCKDCKFSEVIQNDSSGVMSRYCRAFTVPMMRADDDFCSYGSRSEKPNNSKERSSE